MIDKKQIERSKLRMDFFNELKDVMYKSDNPNNPRESIHRWMQREMKKELIFMSKMNREIIEEMIKISPKKDRKCLRELATRVEKVR